jgi:hypothetical protein
MPQNLTAQNWYFCAVFFFKGLKPTKIVRHVQNRATCAQDHPSLLVVLPLRLLNSAHIVIYSIDRLICSRQLFGGLRCMAALQHNTN